MSFEQHLNAIQNELQQLNHLLMQEKDKLERSKQEQKTQQMQWNSVMETYQASQQELLKDQKIFEKYSNFLNQYLPQIPQEAQVQLSGEFEKVKQSLQPADPHQMSMMAGNMAAMGNMPLNAMMALQATAHAQLGRGMLPGMTAPSPRVPKSNGMPGLPPNIANGLGAQMAAMQNPMLAAAMPSSMAQLQAMAAFSANMQAQAMSQFNQAQLAAMQASMGMNGLMLPPLPNPAGMVNPMGLSVSTPSRNPSNGGPLSGTRTPQSGPSNGVNSPRPVVKEEPLENTKKEEAIEDSVAVA